MRLIGLVLLVFVSSCGGHEENAAPEAAPLSASQIASRIAEVSSLVEECLGYDASWHNASRAHLAFAKDSRVETAAQCRAMSYQNCDPLWERQEAEVRSSVERSEAVILPARNGMQKNCPAASDRIRDIIGELSASPSVQNQMEWLKLCVNGTRLLGEYARLNEQNMGDTPADVEDWIRRTNSYHDDGERDTKACLASLKLNPRAIASDGSGAGSMAAKHSNMRTSADPLARCSVQESPPIQAATRRLCKRAIADANSVESDDYRYRVDGAKVIRASGFGGDGDPGLLLLIETCEEQNCHSTTRTTFIAHVSSDGAEDKHVRTVPGSIEIKEFNGPELVLTRKEFADNDPTCCPSIVREDRIIF